MSGDSYALFFQGMAERAARSEYDGLYLWPRTPMGHDHQDKIKERVGATDRDVEDSRSRTHLILQHLRVLQAGTELSPDAVVLDIACGDALVLGHIKRTFPGFRCHGFDCNVDRFGTHREVREYGVDLHQGFIQHLFGESPARPFDVIMMLNTYRGWESADLRPHERDLPQKADAWLSAHARFAFLTATDRQITRLGRMGHAVERLGKGEDDSSMICVRPGAGRKPWWRAILPFAGSARKVGA